MQKLVLLMLLACLSNIVNAMDEVGSVVLSVGENYALNLNGNERPLTRNGSLYEHDTITTSARGRVHLKFTDGTTISLKPDTRFRIATYLFNAEKGENNAAFFQLLKGGLRTVSGEIGKLNPKRRRMQTILATIGIRGTEYELYVCDTNCAETYEVPEGMAGGVDDGGINVSNVSGVKPFDKGKYFMIVEGNDEVAELDERPAMLAIGDEPKPEPEPLTEIVLDVPVVEIQDDCEKIAHNSLYNPEVLHYNCTRPVSPKL